MADQRQDRLQDCVVLAQLTTLLRVVGDPGVVTEVGGSLRQAAQPATVSTSVVLPEPFGAQQGDLLAAFEDNVDVVDQSVGRRGRRQRPTVTAGAFISRTTRAEAAAEAGRA